METKFIPPHRKTPEQNCKHVDKSNNTNLNILDKIFTTTVFEHEIRRFRISRIAKQVIFNTTVLKTLGVLLLFVTLTFGWNKNEVLYAEQNVNDTAGKFTIDAIAGVAGEDVNLKAKHILPYHPVEFEVILPSGKAIVMSSMADIDGETKVSLPGLNTGKSGVYTLSARSPELIPHEKISFIVNPGTPNPKTSKIKFSTKNRLANGKDEEKITITLRDRFGNTIPKRKVSLFSSRSSDLILRLTGETNNNGEITFGVRSFEPGSSILSALDEQSNTVFSAKSSINFISPIIEDAIGGDDRMLLASSHESAQAPIENEQVPIESKIIMISVVDPEIIIGTPFGIQVDIVNQDMEPLTDYEGTIHFESNNTGAVLPSDFTFAPENQGNKLFDFGVTFMETGSGHISVMDINDNAIRGEIQVVVLANMGTEVSSESPVILSPQNNSKTNQNSLTLSGTAQRNSRIVAYDQTQKIGEAVSLPDNTFDIEISNMTDGSHSFTVLATDTDGNISPISNAVTIIIDTVPPTPENTQVNPGKVGTMEKFRITVISEENLIEAKAIVDKRAIILSPSELATNIYEAEIASPESPGDYPIDIILTDEVGNSQTYKDQTSLEVEGSLSPVSGIKSVEGDESVFLNWDPVETAIRYKIYYGTFEGATSDFIETTSDKTSGTITGLENDLLYFFTIVAVNEAGDESQMSANSQTNATPSFELGAIDTSEVKDTPDTGPGLILLLTGMTLAGAASFGRKI